MLLELEELKSYLKITSNNQDALLNTAISQADSFIKDYTWRNLEAKDYTDIRDWRWESSVILKDYPVNSFTSYECNYWTISSEEWTSYDIDRYWVNKEEWILRSFFRMNKWIQNNKLIYNAWYQTIPADLTRVATRIATYFYSGAWKLKQWVKKESVDGASIEYDTTTDAIEAEIYSIMDKYKII